MPDEFVHVVLGSCPVGQTRIALVGLRYTILPRTFRMRVGSLGPCCVDLDEMHYAGLANVLSSRSRLGTLAGIEASPGGSRIRL